MIQSKIESLIETSLDVGSGFICAMLLWGFVVTPILNIEHNIAQNFAVTSLFTFFSLIRKYYWRRFFAAGIHLIVHEQIKKLRGII